MRLIVVMANWSKSCQKVEELSKVKKSQRPEKSAKVINSEKPSFLTSANRLVVTKMGPSQNLVQNSRWRTTGHCWNLEELKALPGSRKPVIIASDSLEIQEAQAPVKGAKKILEPRILESFTSSNQRSLCTKVCLQNARPPFTQILEMRSGRRRPSLGLGQGCLIAGKMLKKLCITKAYPMFLKSLELIWLLRKLVARKCFKDLELPPINQLQLGRDYLYLPIGRTKAMIWSLSSLTSVQK